MTGLFNHLNIILVSFSFIEKNRVWRVGGDPSGGQQTGSVNGQAAKRLRVGDGGGNYG